jgi:L-fuconolactonase
MPVAMQTIDSHQHFWIYDPQRDSWIDENMQVIRRNFLPADLQPVLQTNGINGCVAVQADQSEYETNYLLGLAAENTFIKGVVGWADLRSIELEKHLEQWRGNPLLKGFRHVLQGEKDRALMLQPAFIRGLRTLQRHSYTYDILVFPDQLKYVEQLTGALPDMPFVIDHLAKPYIRSGNIDGWEHFMSLIAQHSHVYCKVSGMVTEAAWNGWTYEQLVPYLDVVTEAFGTQRLMYGSDWPVCLVAAQYSEVVGVVRRYFESFSQVEKDAIFGGNAAQFYRL